MVSSSNIGSLRSTSPSSSKRTFKSNGLAIAVEKEWTRKEWTTAKSGKMNRFRWKGEHQLNRKGDGPSARPHDSALAAEKMIQKRAMQRKLELRNASVHSQNAPCNENDAPCYAGAHGQNASAHGRNGGTRASACKRPKRGHASERMQTTRPPHSAMQAMQNGHEQKKAPAVGFETWTTASARRGLATRDKQDSCIEHTYLAI